MQIANLTGLLSTGIYYGLYVSNDASTPNTVIDIAAGAAVDAQQAQIMVLPTAFTKSLASTFVQGTGNGGLDTGSIAANTWYYAWLIMNPTTGVVDVLLSVSSTTPTMPSGFTWSRRIRGAFRTDATSKIIGFWQFGDYTIMWGNSVVSTNTNGTFLDVNANNPGTSAVSRTLTVPPLTVETILNILINSTTVSPNVYISSTFNVNEVASVTAAPLATILDSTAIGNIAGQIRIYADASSQIRTRLSTSDGNTNLRIATLGWREALS